MNNHINRTMQLKRCYSKKPGALPSNISRNYSPLGHHCQDEHCQTSLPYPFFQDVFLNALVKALGKKNIPINRYRWKKLFWLAVSEQKEMRQ